MAREQTEVTVNILVFNIFKLLIYDESLRSVNLYSFFFLVMFFFFIIILTKGSKKFNCKVFNLHDIYFHNFQYFLNYYYFAFSRIAHESAYEPSASAYVERTAASSCAPPRTASKNTRSSSKYMSSFSNVISRSSSLPAFRAKSLTLAYGSTSARRIPSPQTSNSE